MSMQTNAATGPSDQTAKVVPQHAVTDTLGVGFAKKYYAVMAIYAYLVASQSDTCQQPTSTT